MKNVIYTVVSNERLAENVYKMILSGDTSAVTAPGQFINIKVEPFYLRRPISVFDCEDGRLSIIYKVVGAGTEKMSKMEKGTELDCLSGLGNGFDISVSGENPVVIGGGAGVPPLYYLAKKLIQNGKTVTAVLGFNKADEIFAKEDFEKLGVKTVITTADGSYGIKGFVTDALKNMDYSYFYACGPEPMLKALCDKTKTSGQLSFEERMGCGFGACMGCSCETKYGSKRICRDGPVLVKEEIVWKI